MFATKRQVKVTRTYAVECSKPPIVSGFKATCSSAIHRRRIQLPTLVSERTPDEFPIIETGPDSSGFS